MESSTRPTTGPGVGDQALLKRRTGSTIAEFREHYILRHAPIAIPWCLANGVTYYAQARRSRSSKPVDYIHRPLRWSSLDLQAKYEKMGIDLDEWDAVGEMVFPPVNDIDDFYRPKVGKTYHVKIILPDEKKFLLDEAMKTLQGVEPGSVEGDRVELIVDGKAVVDVGGWQIVFDEFDKYAVDDTVDDSVAKEK